MEEIKPMKLQEVFNNAWNGVLVHGFSTSLTGGCVYTDVLDGNRHCGIGWSIHQYISSAENSRTIWRLIYENQKIGKLFENIGEDDASALQQIHDREAGTWARSRDKEVSEITYLRKFAKRMIDYAKARNLTVPPIPQGNRINDSYEPS